MSNKTYKKYTRYNHVLEAVVSYTKELAYKQAKDADELLARGVYLGTSFLNYSDILSE
jgi:Asp-tRNA(Asn)/Glu-tRNA(Gln) amidotransferase A subunit family amidase